jgi:hypothetical protein
VRIAPIDFLPPDALARLLEQARMSVQTGTEGTEFPEGEEEDILLGGPLRDADYARTMRGMVGLRFCAAVYGSAKREEGLLAADFACWAMHAGVWTMEYDTENALIAAVKSCGARILEVPGLAERLATSKHDGVRYALAQALPKTAVSALQALARDANHSVREAANARLDVTLRTDAFPISTEGHDETVLAKARRILELPRYQYGDHQRAAIRAIAPLSDTLAVAVWERLLLAGHVGSTTCWAWLRALLERPSGEHALVRLLLEWQRTGELSSLAYGFEKIGKVSDAARARTIEALVSAMSVAPDERYLRSHIARCAAALVTPRYDMKRLLEFVLGVSIEKASETDEDDDYAMGELAKGLDNAASVRALQEVLLPALRNGKKGRWKRLPRSVWKRLSPDPVVRESARAQLNALASLDEKACRKLVLTLLEHRFPKLDGTETKLVRGLFAHASLRPTLIEQTKAGRSLARRSLLRGELSIEAVCEFAYRIAEDDPESDKLWTAVRKARDAALSEAVTLDLCALIQPGERWAPSDLAVAQRGCAILIAHEPVHVNFHRFMHALGMVQTSESRAMQEEVAEKTRVPALKDYIMATLEIDAMKR